MVVRAIDAAGNRDSQGVSLNLTSYAAPDDGFSGKLWRSEHDANERDLHVLVEFVCGYICLLN